MYRAESSNRFDKEFSIHLIFCEFLISTSLKENEGICWSVSPDVFFLKCLVQRTMFWFTLIFYSTAQTDTLNQKISSKKDTGRATGQSRFDLEFVYRSEGTDL